MESVSLRRDERGLALVGDGLELRGDFTRMLPRLRAGRIHGELLVRAAKVKPHDSNAAPVAVDATAGLGEDAILLAAAGFQVLMFERNPVIAALLRDAMERARGVPKLAGAMERMELVEADSVQALGRLSLVPDVVVLDPMFPARSKSAAVKKKAQLLQQLEQPCEDERALLQAAMAAHPRKVVVKRPLKGPRLAGVAPSYTLKGKAVRYDCIVLP